MDLDTSRDNRTIDNERMKKYRLAGYGFLLLNLLYGFVAWWFLPPFNLGFTAIAYAAVYVILMGLLSGFIAKGRRGLVRVLAVLYGARSLFLIYSMIAGDTFAAVPYMLPCLLGSFYLLGRAGWNWP